jgi:nucleoside 2-deoxyribosyltransferase
MHEEVENSFSARGDERPFVLVIMPFDPDWTDLYEYGVKFACEAAGATCARVDEQIFLESILERIYAEIERADLIVSEMTGRNPNVFYETGYAHGLAKPVILLTTSADDIPFDLRHYPHVVHERRINVLRPELEKRVRWCIENPEQARATLRRGASDRDELERMAQHISNYLEANRFTMVGFERVRENINPSYSDDKLQRLIEFAPSRFRRVRMKGNRPGIGLARS